MKSFTPVSWQTTLAALTLKPNTTKENQVLQWNLYFNVQTVCLAERIKRLGFMITIFRWNKRRVLSPYWQSLNTFWLFWPRPFALQNLSLEGECGLALAGFIGASNIFLHHGKSQTKAVSDEWWTLMLDIERTFNYGF